MFVTPKVWRKRACVGSSVSTVVSRKHAWGLKHSFTKLLPLSGTLTMAEVVFSGVANDTDVQGTLFQGIKFWISLKVPQRLRFLSDVKVKSS